MIFYHNLTTEGPGRRIPRALAYQNFLHRNVRGIPALQGAAQMRFVFPGRQLLSLRQSRPACLSPEQSPPRLNPLQDSLPRLSPLKPPDLGGAPSVPPAHFWHCGLWKNTAQPSSMRPAHRMDGLPAEGCILKKTRPFPQIAGETAMPSPLRWFMSASCPGGPSAWPSSAPPPGWGRRSRRSRRL